MPEIARDPENARDVLQRTAPPRSQLLVSVQSEREAEIVAGLEVGWIDLKNPKAGSLGSPPPGEARRVASLLKQRPQKSSSQLHSSVALGELKDLDGSSALELMSLFPVAKVGFSGLAHLSDLYAGTQLERLIREKPLDSELVPAAYVDFQRARAPDLDAMVDLALRLESRYLLLDTCVKDGQGLFHWLTAERFERIATRLEGAGAQLVVAGSLSMNDWPLLSSLISSIGPLIVGVRGAVCQGCDRTSSLSEQQIEKWVAWIDHQTNQAPQACPQSGRKA